MSATPGTSSGLAMLASDVAPSGPAVTRTISKRIGARPRSVAISRTDASTSIPDWVRVRIDQQNDGPGRGEITKLPDRFFETRRVDRLLGDGDQIHRAGAKLGNIVARSFSSWTALPAFAQSLANSRSIVRGSSVFACQLADFDSVTPSEDDLAFVAIRSSYGRRQVRPSLASSISAS